jgi:Zinc finger, C2H2 type
MVKYECKRCRKVFNHKGDYDRHMNRKNPCEEVKEEVKEAEAKEEVKNSELKCPFCEKEFKTKYNVSRHIKNNVCNAKRKTVELVEENKQLKEELQELKTQMSNNINTTNNNSNNITNTTNNTTNNNSNNTTNNITTVTNNTFNVVAYGKEDIDKILSNEKLQEGLRKNPDATGVILLIKTIHLNEDIPEHHNISLYRMKDEDLIVFNGKVWKPQKTKETVTGIVEENINRMKKVVNKSKSYGHLNKSSSKKYKCFCDTLRSEEHDKLINYMVEDTKKEFVSGFQMVDNTMKRTPEYIAEQERKKKYYDELVKTRI